MFSEIPSRKKSDIVRDQIIEMVLTGALKCGDRLPVENDLAEQFSVSRITIREAFKELSLMGVVVIKQGDGTFISKTTPDFYMKPLLPILLFNEKNIDQLYDARIYIESGTVALAALNRTDEQLLHLEEIVATISKHCDDKCYDERYSTVINEFHEYIASICGNDFLYKIFTTINHILGACIEQSVITEHSKRHSTYEHQQILKCIRNKNPQLAEAMMKLHIENAKANFYIVQQDKLNKKDSVK